MPLRTLPRQLPVLLVPGALKVQQVFADFAAQVPIDRNQPLAVFAEQLPVNSRLVVEPREVRLAAQQQQVLPPLVVHREQHEVIPALAPAAVRPVRPRLARRRDIRLHPENRLDALGLARFIEGHGPEHVAVVGDRTARHPKLDEAIDQLLDLVATVKQRVLSVQVQVRERPEGPPALRAGRTTSSPASGSTLATTLRCALLASHGRRLCPSDTVRQAAWRPIVRGVSQPGPLDAAAIFST